MVYTLRDGLYKPALFFGRISRRAHWETATQVIQALNQKLQSLSEEGQNSRDTLAAFWCQQYIERIFPVQDCYLTTATVMDGVRTMTVPSQQPVYDTLQEMIPYGVDLPDAPILNDGINAEQDQIEDEPADISYDESDEESDSDSSAESGFDE